MVSTSAPSIRTTLLQHVGAGERGGAEHGRADLRRTTADVRSRELAHGRDVLRGTTLPAILAGMQRRSNRRGAQSAPDRAAVRLYARCCGAALPLSGASRSGSLVLGRSA